MDFLFLNHSASVEAIIVFLSLFIIFLFLLYDAIYWMKQKYRELHPRKIFVESIPPVTTIETKDEPKQTENTQLSSEVPIENINVLVSDLESAQVSGDTHRVDDIGESPSPGPSESKSSIEGVDSVMSKDDPAPASSESNGNIDEVSTPAGEIEMPPIETSITPLEEGASGSLDVEAEKVSPPPESSEELKAPTFEKETPPSDTAKTKTEKKKSLSPEKKEKVTEIVNNARTLIARGHIDDARSLIVNGLSLEKNNRELNLLMAGLYERDRAFEKAEFILKELAESDPNDTEVLQHLATVVAMQRKFELSYELYKKILLLNGETEDTLYTLVHIASELSLTEDIYNYAKSYLKQFPKNPDILWLYSQSQITKADRKGAIETLIKLKNLTPYNQEIVDLISKLVTEDELAGNFGEGSNSPF